MGGDGGTVMGIELSDGRLKAVFGETRMVVVSSGRSVERSAPVVGRIINLGWSSWRCGGVGSTNMAGEKE